VLEVTLADGTQLVAAGAVVAGAPAVDIATIDFLARGGDSYPLTGLPFTTLGVTYQQALSDYIASSSGLNGVVSAAAYPEGGTGRITRVN
jgi:5'-nucleotidase